MKSLSCPSFAVSAPWFTMASFCFALFSFQLWQSGWNNYLRYRPEQQKCDSWGISAGGRPWLGIKTNGEMCLEIFPCSPLLPVTMSFWRWIVYTNEQCESYIIVARSNFRRRGSCREKRAWNFVICSLQASNNLVFHTHLGEVLYYTTILHPPVWLAHTFFYIINDTLYLSSVIKSNLFIHLFNQCSLGAF